MDEYEKAALDYLVSSGNINRYSIDVGSVVIEFIDGTIVSFSAYSDMCDNAHLDIVETFRPLKKL